MEAPPDTYEDMGTCFSSGEQKSNKLAKFEADMNSEKAMQDCNCQPNCEEITYETQVTHSYALKSCYV